MKLKSFSFKPYSPKQAKVLTWWMRQSPYSDWDGLIADGSIRSGKTVSMIDGFIEWSRSSFTGQNFILSGKSMNALKRNVIGPMRQILAAKRIAHSYNRSDNCLEFGGNTYYCFGANTEASQDVLQGLTAAGWLGDEVALQPENFIQQAIGRCSVDGAKIWLNCNPESPQHYVKTDLIDKARDKRLLHLHFTLDDNRTLSPKTRARYCRMFTGVWFKRYILGLWVAAEGAIYDMLDKARHVVDKLPAMVEYHVGVDYGTSGVTTFWLLGIGTDKRLYFVDFWRWDVSKKHRQLSDAEAVEELDKWLVGLEIVPKTVVIPNDAASFLAEIKRSKRAGRLRNIVRVSWANQAPGSVLLGIRDCHNLFSRDMLLFSREVERKGGLKEWTDYRWDPDKPGDVPIKEHDHDPDAGRYVVEHTKHTWSKWLYASDQPRMAA